MPNGGYDLFEVAVDPSTWLVAHDYLDDRPPPVVVRDDEAKVTAPRPYRPLETLAPQTWTGTYQLGDSPSATIETSGADAVDLHSYSLAVGTQPRQRRHQHRRVVRLWRACARRCGSRRRARSSTAAATRIDGVGKTFREEDWSATVSSSIPFESRPGQTWSMSFDYDVDWFRLVGEPMFVLDPTQRVPTHPPTDYVQAGVGGRVGYSRVHSVTYGLGPNNGFDAAVSMRLDHPGARRDLPQRDGELQLQHVPAAVGQDADRARRACSARSARATSCARAASASAASRRRTW